MKGIKLRAWGNIFLFLSFLVSAFSGLILGYVLPGGNGFRGGRGLVDVSVFLSLGRGEWVDIHTYSGLVFLVLAIIHFVVHWNWIKNLPKLLKS
jgi:hypothetical protein